MKLLVGRKYDSPEVQRELKRNPFRTAKMPNGGVGISFTYKDEEILVPVEQVLAMMLVKAKDIAFKAINNVNIAESVLAVPNWFTDNQRRALMHACDIAQLNCLKITNESNAIALSYGIFKSAKKLFSETEPTYIMFIDLGYSCYCVTIVSFIQENMKILSSVCDRNLGGRDFDDVVVEFMAESFQKQSGIDVRNNWKAVMKMRVAAEKGKKTLSPAGVNEARISVECLADDRDLNVNLTRDEFEIRCAHLLARLEEPIMRCLQEAGLTKEQIFETEIVGGGTRVNCVKRRIGEILGLDPSAVNYGLKTTMNSDEAVARGSALQCALLSSRIKVKTFNIVDRLPYKIVAHFEATSANGEFSGEDSKEDVDIKGSSATLYEHNDEVPHKPRRLTFKKKSSDFTVTLAYDDPYRLPESEDPFIAKYTIKIPSELSQKGPSDVRVTFNLDRNSCVYLQSAQWMEEYFVEESKAPEAKDEKEGDKKETEVKPEMKKKFKKVDLAVETEIFGLTRDDIRKAMDLEGAMAYEDRLITETADARNDLETYIYAMRDKLEGSLKDYCDSTTNSDLVSAMNKTEDWLYNDGFDATKLEYVQKLNELRGIGDAIESRLKEFTNRPAAIEALRKQIELCRSFVSTYDDAHAHITEEERDKIRDALRKSETWMFDMQNKQGDMALHVDPILTTDTIQKQRSELFSITNPIMSKPKPAPAPTPTPAATTEAKDESKEEGTKTTDENKPEASKEDESIPMDLET
jgi:heat shock protein 4